MQRDKICRIGKNKYNVLAAFMRIGMMNVIYYSTLHFTAATLCVSLLGSETNELFLFSYIHAYAYG